MYNRTCIFPSGLVVAATNERLPVHQKIGPHLPPRIFDSASKRPIASTRHVGIRLQPPKMFYIMYLTGMSTRPALSPIQWHSAMQTSCSLTNWWYICISLPTRSENVVVPIDEFGLPFTIALEWGKQAPAHQPLHIRYRSLDTTVANHDPRPLPTPPLARPSFPNLPHPSRLWRHSSSQQP